MAASEAQAQLLEVEERLAGERGELEALAHAQRVSDRRMEVAVRELKKAWVPV